VQADLAVKARPAAAVRSGGAPTTVVTALSGRSAVRSAVPWDSDFGVAIASSKVSDAAACKTTGQRQVLAATYGTSTAISALFGPAPHLETVRGFTAVTISVTPMILVAVWAPLTSTRLLRGEEDAGRWDLLVCGQATRPGATAQGLAGLGAGVNLVPPALVVGGSAC